MTETAVTTKALVSITDKAAQQIKHLIEKRDKPTLGVRLLLVTKGCSGLKYKIEYAEKIEPGDKVIEHKDVKLLIDPKALLFVIGTIMDYVETPIKSGFTFTNPNIKGECGCGESFYV